MTLNAKTLTVAPSVSPFQHSLWIRTAAGPQIGFGHLKRCFTLAQALRDCLVPLFLLDHDDSWTIEQVEAKGWSFTCRNLDEVWRSVPEPSGILIDTRLTSGLDGLIAVAKSRGIPVISIHDLGLTPVASDIAIDGSIAPATGDIFLRSLRYCSGTDYMVLDPLYSRLHRRAKTHRAKIRSVFVNLGGGDSARYFSAVLEGLKLWSRELDVIGAPGFTSWGQEALGRRNWTPMRFRWETTRVQPVLFRADLAITAGGLSAYESLCAGTPLAALSFDPLQQSTITALAAKGACIDLGRGDELDPLQLAEVLSQIDSNPDRRERLSVCGRKLVDGRGAERVAQIIRHAILNAPVADFGRGNA